MQRRTLGTSSLEISVLSFGAWQIGDPQYWGEPAKDAETVSADAAVHAALDAGINLFDTAEMYGDGESERALGRALGHRRTEVYIASKVKPENCASPKLVAACEASLKRLGTDYIDLYQVHWPPRDVPFDECCLALACLKEAGKIREIGVSNFGVSDLADWFEIGPCVSDQIGYNLAFRAPEFDILPACERREVGVLVYMPLLQGILTGRWRNADEIPLLRRRTRHFAAGRPGVRHNEPGCEPLLFAALDGLNRLAEQTGHSTATLALAWLLAQPAVTSVIIGARRPQQVSRNVAAANLTLDPRVLAEIETLTAPIKAALGPNPDMWQTKSRIH